MAVQAVSAAPIRGTVRRLVFNLRQAVHGLLTKVGSISSDRGFALVSDARPPPVQCGDEFPESASQVGETDYRHVTEALPGVCFGERWGPERPPGSGKRVASIIRLKPSQAGGKEASVITCSVSDFPTRSAVCKRCGAASGPSPYIQRS